MLLQRERDSKLNKTKQNGSRKISFIRKKTTLWRLSVISVSHKILKSFRDVENSARQGLNNRPSIGTWSSLTCCWARSLPEVPFSLNHSMILNTAVPNCNYRGFGWSLQGQSMCRTSFIQPIKYHWDILMGKEYGVNYIRANC